MGLQSIGHHWACTHQFSSVPQSCPTLCDPMDCSMARPPCSSPTPGVYSNSCPLSRWCHPTISSFIIPFSSYLRSFPASGSFQMSQFFALGGQSIAVSASTSVLPMNIQVWFPLFFYFFLFVADFVIHWNETAMRLHVFPIPIPPSFRMDWLDLLAVQGTLKSLLQHHSLKASILQCSAFFIVQLSHS